MFKLSLKDRYLSSNSMTLFFRKTSTCKKECQDMDLCLCPLLASRKKSRLSLASVSIQRTTTTLLHSPFEPMFPCLWTFPCPCHSHLLSHYFSTAYPKTERLGGHRQSRNHINFLSVSENKSWDIWSICLKRQSLPGQLRTAPAAVARLTDGCHDQVVNCCSCRRKSRKYY